MKINDVKKALYKEKPIAKFDNVTKSGIMYYTVLKENLRTVLFIVPLTDIGDGIFNDEMEGQLLIRYIVEPKN